MIDDNDVAPKRKSQAKVHADRVQARKDKRSAKKARHSQRNRVGSLVTSSDVEHIAVVIHGESHNELSSSSPWTHPLTSDKTIDDVIERNFSLVSKMQAHKIDLCKEARSGGKENKDQKRVKRADGDDVGGAEMTVDVNEVVSAIMLKLGVSSIHVKASLPSNNSSSSNGNDISSKSHDAFINTPPSSQSRKRTTTATATATLHPFLSSVSSTMPHSIPISTTNSSDTPKAILNTTLRLRASITRDLTIHGNEVHATAARAAGFWRYVGKVVFQRMAERAET